MEGAEASSYEEQMAERKRAWKQQQEEGDGAEEIIDGDAEATGADASQCDEASGGSVPAEVAALKERGNAAYKAREYEEAVKVRAAAAPPPSIPAVRLTRPAGAVLHGGPAGGQRREGQGRAGGAQVAVAEPRCVPPAPGAVRAVRGRQHRCAPEL